MEEPLTTVDIVTVTILYIWYILFVVQAYFGYGTAYRATKKGGDNGVALFGWEIVYTIAAIVPGLGFYLWYRSRDIKPLTCSACSEEIKKGSKFCTHCGTKQEKPPKREEKTICGACEKEINETDKFCNNCGAQFKKD